MNIRYINKPIYGTSSKFNTAEFISMIEVQLSDSSWVNMSEAFKNKILIPDNYNTCFKEAKTDEERKKGYYL
jgi:hypothetical protein